MNNYTHPYTRGVFFLLGSRRNVANRPSKARYNRKILLLLATHNAFPKISQNPFKGSPGNVATRPSKLDITGNFFQSSDRFFSFPRFSQKPQDPAPKNFISRSIRFQHIYLPKSLSRISLHLTTFLVSNFLPGPHQPAPAANSKIWRYPLLLFIISIGTRSPSMEKENSQVKRCSFS